MPRKPRQFEVGGIYHIVNRGYEKRDIFLDEADHIRFIESLYYFNDQNFVEIRDRRRADKQVLGNGGLTPVASVIAEDKREPLVEILAFVLMPNHYHLILREIKDSGISAFMQKLGTGYSVYFNEKYDRKGVGSIFGGTYKSVHIKSDIQLSNVFVYVHTNPVEIIDKQWKDLIVKDEKAAIEFLNKYKWSSYHDYTGGEKFPGVTNRRFFLDFYGGHNGCRNAVHDWIKFKAQNAELGPEVIE